jgi:hypothetical protein
MVTKSWKGCQPLTDIRAGRDWYHSIAHPKVGPEPEGLLLTRIRVFAVFAEVISQNAPVMPDHGDHVL